MLWEAATSLGLEEATGVEGRGDGGRGLDQVQTANRETKADELHLMHPLAPSSRSYAGSSLEVRSRLRRRFLFKPCPTLERWIDSIERELAERRFGGEIGSGGRTQVERVGKGSSGYGILGSKVSGEASVDEIAYAAVAAVSGRSLLHECLPVGKRRQKLRLRALEPG